MFDPVRHADEPELHAALERAMDLAEQASGGEPSARNLWHFYALYNDRVGVFGDRPGNRYRMTRRQWVESLVVLVDKRARPVPFIYNQSQRNLEAILLRQSRRQNPRRVVILKVRQNGISTYTLACFLHAILTTQNMGARVITDREDLCEMLLQRMRMMFERLRKKSGQPWDLAPSRSNRDMISLGAPFNSRIQVVSANTPSPGFGETNLFLDMEETSKWPDAEEKGKGVEMALPEVPESLAIDVSQAKGNTGYFARKFKRAWYRKKGMAAPDDVKLEDDADDGSGLVSAGWEAMFIPWFLHQEYRWTNIGGHAQHLPASLVDHIQRTLTNEERILLEQTYFLRGVGYRKVDVDQLAWRRYCLAEKCHGNLQIFHEQFPAFPEEALLASGKSAFNVDHVQHKLATHVRPPMQVGKVLLDNGQPRVLDDRHGALSVWRVRAAGRRYAIGADTAAGVRGGDPCVAYVIDVETEAIVAEWYGWEPPHVFGRTLKALSDIYEALVAVETHPSQHGLAVFEAAVAAGCERMWVQQRWEDRSGQFVTRKGWVMSAQGKAVVVDRVNIALANDKADAPAQRLLQECLDAQLDELEKIDRKCRNDCIMAYGIALKLADHVRTEERPKLEEESLPPTGSDEDFWRRRRQRTGVSGSKYDSINGAGI